MIRKLWLIFAQAVTVSAGIAVGLTAVTDWRPFAPAQEAVHIPDFSSAVERAAPAVVTIFARHATPGKRAEQIGTNWNSLPEEDFNTLGSGVLVSSDGFVLTNYHVVASIQGLYVGLPDGGQAEAVLVGSDPETDLALIKISGESDLPFIGLGDTSKLKVGQSVLAIGNPFDVGQTVTSGIISALGRHGLGLNSYEDFIQTDAAINQGNSGGALVNTEGELIGINTAIIASGQGIGFAIPSNMAAKIINQIKSGKKISRGWIGVSIQDMDENTAKALGMKEPSGALVGSVMENEPAAKGGVQDGDVIIAVDKKDVEDAAALLRAIADKAPGSTAVLTVWRDGKNFDLKVTLGERKSGQNDGRPGMGQMQQDEGLLGLSVRPLKEEERREMKLSKDEGLLIVDVDPDKPAAEADLRPGDVILKANLKPVNSGEALSKIVKEVGVKRGAIMLQIERRGDVYFRTIPLGK